MRCDTWIAGVPNTSRLRRQIGGRKLNRRIQAGINGRLTDGDRGSWPLLNPQVFTQFADVTMYRWEYNFRASTVMGMVGAGGIGTELVGSLRLLDYAQVSAILIVILAAVSLVDALSGILRRAFQ